MDRQSELPHIIKFENDNCIKDNFMYFYKRVNSLNVKFSTLVFGVYRVYREISLTLPSDCCHL